MKIRIYLFLLIIITIIFGCDSKEFFDENRTSKENSFLELCRQNGMKVEEIDANSIEKYRSISQKDFEQELKIFDYLKNGSLTRNGGSSYFQVIPQIDRKLSYERLTIKAPAILIAPMNKQVSIAIILHQFTNVVFPNTTVSVEGLSEHRISNVYSIKYSLPLDATFNGFINFEINYIVRLSDVRYLSITQNFAVSITFHVIEDVIWNPLMKIDIRTINMDSKDESIKPDPDDSGVIFPSPLDSCIGSDCYYSQRINDFLKRNPNANIPVFYKYADFYTYELMHNVDFKDKMITKMALIHKQTQQKLSNYLLNSSSIELNDTKLINTAINDCISPVVNPIIVHDMSILDQLTLALAFYPEDLLSIQGVNWINDLGREQIAFYQINRSYAWQHAQELMQNWNLIRAMVDAYLNNRVTSTQLPSRNEIINRLFGVQIDYFENIFNGDFYLVW